MSEKYTMKCCADGSKGDAWNIVEHENNLFVAVGFHKDRLAALVRAANMLPKVMEYACHKDGCSSGFGDSHGCWCGLGDLKKSLRECEPTPAGEGGGDEV